MCTWVNEKSWEMTRICFPDAKQIENSKKNGKQRMYICSKNGDQIDENFDSPPDNEHSFLASYFHE